MVNRLQRFPEIDFHPTLPVLMARAVERYGDRDFVVLAEQRLTFREADRRSALLARRMLAWGAGKGTRMGIALPTGIDWVIAWLAAGRIGAMPMLFPATYRPAELRRALRIGDVALLITARTMLGKDHETFVEQAVPALLTQGSGRLRDPSVPYLRSVWMLGGSDRTWATSVDLDSELPVDVDVDASLLAAVEQEVVPSDPLLVVYTSGSSADPKAVVHTHGATIRKMQPELNVCMPASYGGSTFCAMPFFWVGGPQELLGALLVGATVVAQERFDPRGAVELLEREQCVSIQGFLNVYGLISTEPTFAERRLVVKMPDGTVVKSSRGDSVNFGMTETFGPHYNPDWFEYRIVDRESGEILGEGEEGEFCVRGFGLMVEMYKQEREQTFDPDGFYHTGDRGYVEGGRIYFRGRYSDMIKSAGANVSPLEVEQVLLSFADVAEAYVMGIPDSVRGETVGAIVVAASGQGLAFDDLAARVNRELSAYKVPKRWVVLEEQEVPRLANNKPDKRTMRALFGATRVDQ